MDRREFISSLSLLLGGAAGLSALSGIGCSKKPEDMNVILVSLDTLRADHCSFLGYKRKTTPFLEEYASDAVVFENMHTPAPWTDQSHASVFSGLYPRVHSISFKANNKLSFSLASILKNKGYKTAGFVETISLDDRIGLATGFDTWMNVEHPKEYEPNRAPDNNKRVFEWLKQNHQSKFLLFVHYFDIHHPYNPPGKYRHFYRETEYAPDIQVYGGSPWKSGHPSEEIMKQVIDLYDGEINWTDYHLQNLLSKLDDYKLLDKSIVVIFSDHGEGFYEHKLLSHGNSLYQELLRIPVVMKFPDGFGEGARIKSITRNIDITPTVLDYMGIRYKEPMQGVSLTKMINNDEKHDLIFFADGTRYAMSIRVGDWKLIYNHQRDEKTIKDLGLNEPKPEFELYNIANDPLEQKDLAPDNEKKVQEYFELIKKSFDLNKNWKRGFIMGQKKALDKDLEEGLRQLGYLG
ncbi:MAG: sulfatase [Acidobacteria bacterium]|nr:sulfatase [Acidobacteriota bacterium]